MKQGAGGTPFSLVVGRVNAFRWLEPYSWKRWGIKKSEGSHKKSVLNQDTSREVAH